MQYGNFIVLAGLLAITYFLLIRPQINRQRQQAAMLADLAVDDQVVTASGIYGTVRTITDDEVHLEIADGVVVRMAKGAIIGKLADR